MLRFYRNRWPPITCKLKTVDDPSNHERHGDLVSIAHNLLTSSWRPYGKRAEKCEKIIVSCFFPGAFFPGVISPWELFLCVYFFPGLLFRVALYLDFFPITRIYMEFILKDNNVCMYAECCSLIFNNNTGSHDTCFARRNHNVT